MSNKKYNFRFYNFNTNGSIHHSLRLFGMSVWAFYYNKGFGWFRLFGRGLKWKDVTVHGLIFSERIRCSRRFQIGKWSIGYLK